MVIQTGDDKFGVAKWIVDPTLGVGTHTTIGAALTSASSGDTIFIRPGTYTENITLKAGVNLTAFSGDQITPNVTILGKASFSSAGTVSISNIQLKTNSDNFLAVTGSAASIVNLEGCFLNANNATGISYTTANTSSQVNLFYCEGDCGATGTYFSYSGTGTTMYMFSCLFPNSGGSSTASTTSAANITVDNSRIEVPLTTSSSGVFTFRNCIINARPTNTTALTTAGTGTIIAFYSRFAGGSASAISIGTGTTVQLFGCDVQSSNTNAITGAGQLNYTPITFSGSSVTINTTTQVTQPFGPIIALTPGPQVQAGTGSPNGAVTAPQGSLYLRTDGSSAITRAYINTNGSTTWTAISTVA